MQGWGKTTNLHRLKKPKPVYSYELSEKIRNAAVLAFTFRLIMSFIMKGDYSERMSFTQTPFAHTWKMHKSCARFFVDNREILIFAGKYVLFLAFFVGTYEGTIFSTQGDDPNVKWSQRPRDRK